MTLAELQNWLKKHKIDAYYVTRNNMFVSEDILPEENKILELTGFSGSAANLLVLQNKAVLFTDGRYEIQSKLETNPQEVEIHCVSGSSPYSWLVQNFESKQTVKMMYDPWCLSATEYAFINRQLPNIKLIEDNKRVLGTRLSDKPVHVFEHKIEYAGISSEEKVSDILSWMENTNLDGYLITAADSVSWLMNLRSDALPDSPVLRAYALIEKGGKITLFGNHQDYPNIQPLSELGKKLKKFKKNKLGTPRRNIPQVIYNFFKNPEHIRLVPDLPQDKKAIKNAVELQGIKKAHLRDAAAMAGFLYWLDNNWQGQSELDIVAKLDEFRKKQDLYYSNSFETIAGFGPNGAIVHYQPKPETNLKLTAGSMLLLDSGAQYYDGTTDITRTIAIGSPSQQMIDDFTLVLKCHIELASAYFPRGTKGAALDTICRRQMWQHGKTYNHGTGHGVGYFLNVHEGPQNLSLSACAQSIEPGMVNSIEPGYYKENAYGIRIENLVCVNKADNPEFDNQSLKFEYLTLVPIDKRLINKYLLSDGEIEWLNKYHQTVFEKVRDLVDDEVKIWLKEACSPI